MDPKLNSMIDDYRKYYVAFHKNPESSEYQNMFNNIQNNLASYEKQKQQEILDLSNQHNSLNKELSKLDHAIKKERNKNNRLKNRVANVMATNGSYN